MKRTLWLDPNELLGSGAVFLLLPDVYGSSGRANGQSLNDQESPASPLHRALSLGFTGHHASPQRAQSLKDWLRGVRTQDGEGHKAYN